jgi:hypothetical protein
MSADDDQLPGGIEELTDLVKSQFAVSHELTPHVQLIGAGKPTEPQLCR